MRKEKIAVRFDRYAEHYALPFAALLGRVVDTRKPASSKNFYAAGAPSLVTSCGSVALKWENAEAA